MAKKKKEYAYNASKRELDIRFYEKYDEDFLYNKALNLAFIAKNPNAFEQFVSTVSGESEKTSQREIDALFAEVHFTEFHQFEAYFAILLAAFQGQPDWLYLTTYPTEEIKSKVEAFLANDIETVTNGLFKDKRAFVQWAYYERYTQPNYTVDEWNENLDNIAWMIERLAKKFIGGAEYNAYKHGLRVMTGGTFLQFATEGANPQVFHRSKSKNSLKFLKCEKQEVKDGVQIERVHEVTMHFEPEESLAHLYFMNESLRKIKNFRLTILNNKVEDEGAKHIFFVSRLNKSDFNVFIKKDRWKVSL